MILLGRIIYILRISILDIYEIIREKLNISIDKNDKKFKLKYSNISNFFNYHDYDECFLIPKSLHFDINNLILEKYKNLSKTKIKNKINTALYIVIIIYNNLFKTDNLVKKCFSSGVQISKEIFSSVLSNKNLYEIKKLLIENEIICYKEYDEIEKYFSKKNGLAIKYILNSKYALDENLLYIENEFTLKFVALLKNGLLYGTKKHSLNSNFLPFDNFEKNIQYLYQKCMYFDEMDFNATLNLKYPNKDVILNGKDTEKKLKLIKLLNCYKSLNSHIFKSSESYGRIYMPFQYVQSDFRKCIRIGHNEKIIEVFDIHCCFVFLTAKLFYSLYDSDEILNECKKIIELCDDDIYKEILDYNKILYSEENRKRIKSNVMRWLFSNRKDRYISIKTNNDIFLIDDFFKHNFPNFYRNVVFYKETNFFKENENGKIIKETKSELSYKCFEMESKIMFDNVLPFLHKKYKEIPFISLHDAIYIPERFKHQIENIKNDVNIIMKDK